MNEHNEDEGWYEFVDEALEIQTRWENIRVINTFAYQKLKDRTIKVIDHLQKLKERRPDCAREQKNYERIFSDYIDEVEELNHERKELVTLMKNIAESETYDENARQDVEWLKNYERKKELTNANRTRMSELIQQIEETIVSIRSAYGTFSKNQITESKQLVEKALSYDAVVECLCMPTHVWEISQHQRLITKAPRHKRETDSMEERQEEEHEVATILTCSRCGAKKDSGPDGLT